MIQINKDKIKKVIKNYKINKLMIMSKNYNNNDEKIF